MREHIFEPEKLRSCMKWGVKYKKSEVTGGILAPAVEYKVFVPVRFLEVPHMHNIKRMIEKNPTEIWNRYPGGLWIMMLNWEIDYQERRINVFITEVMKLQFNTMAEMFREHSNAIYLPSIG